MSIDSLLKFTTSMAIALSTWWLVRFVWNYRKKQKRSQKDAEVDFFFYFKTRNDAENASHTLKDWEFNPEISETEDGQFLVQCRQIMTFDEALVKILGEKFSKLAQDNKGEYDGWGAEL